eukprot:GHVP01011591.1.p3 GENE.GHVP01011591.1~~GHVP01011591.1.p3  ORF type:complete len:304 (-),score=54.30 GHVP01011591.1:2891-3802(-)
MKSVDSIITRFSGKDGHVEAMRLLQRTYGSPTLASVECGGTEAEAAEILQKAGFVCTEKMWTTAWKLQDGTRHFLPSRLIESHENNPVLVELLGRSDTGKSEFAMKTCSVYLTNLSIQKNFETKNKPPAALWIETNERFNAARLAHLIKEEIRSRGKNDKNEIEKILTDALSSLHVVNAPTPDQILSCLKNGFSDISGLPPFIVIDNLITALRRELNSDPPEVLKCSQHNSDVLILGELDSYGGKARAMLGRLWHHSVDCRLILEKEKMIIEKSLSAPCGHLEFLIDSDQGFLFREKSCDWGR